MENNKTSRYFKYAIGEIILVVIGILIALQINNWNEKRKLQAEEVKFLRNFKRSLNSDIKFNSIRAERFSKTKESIGILLQYFEQDLPYQDSLKYHFGRITQTWTIRINSEVFEALKSKDLNLISNDSLRNNLISYYSWSNGILKEDKNRYVKIIENASTDIFNSRFYGLWEGDYQKMQKTGNFEDLKLKMTPNNFNDLKDDKELQYFLRSLKSQLFWLIEDNLKKMNEDAADLIKSIELELTLIT